MIAVDRLSFSYPGRAPVLRDITLTVEPGSHVAVMGPNGSGKSTLALLIKGILSPDGGSVAVDGLSAACGDIDRIEVMRRVGLVFQNPDNTIVATTVERELSFGLENLGVPDSAMRGRVDETLARFDLERYRHTAPDRLSGGERQRLALAAVMIMRPSHLVLDEPTSLLDPAGAARIRGFIRETASLGTTIVHITQSAREAMEADRVIVISDGAIVRDGPPAKALADVGEFGIEGVGEADGVIPRGDEAGVTDSRRESMDVLILDRVGRTYDPGTSAARKALDEVTFAVRRGEATVLLGSAGSGKTTLLEIAAGIEPQSAGTAVIAKGAVRSMAFQFPEDQVFGDTVEGYVEFGPGNLGFSKAETARSADRALESAGLDPERYRGRDPLTLSGGEKRRVAIAGALAMRPDMLILDEPTAGLDRRGTDHLLDVLGGYVRDGGALLFSTHDFRAAARLADRAVVLDGGRLETAGSVREVFERSPWIREVRD